MVNGFLRTASTFDRALVYLEAAGEERHSLGAKIPQNTETVARADVNVEQDDVDVLIA